MKNDNFGDQSFPLPGGTLLFHGRYRILRVLGRGGFGITYEAEQTTLGRRVAIKEFFLKGSVERSSGMTSVTTSSSSRLDFERYRSKFLKEARTMAGMEHPHIVRIIDLFEENGTAYYVMKYLPGGSLSDMVKRSGPLSPDTAVRYVHEVGSALSYLHGRRINHLDVKPGNILLDGEGHAVLIDFGLSKRYDGDGKETSSTPVGVSAGYAPIEQYDEGGLRGFSPESDIYALGATLYYLLSGKRPPAASDVLNGGLPRPGVRIPDALWSSISKAMSPGRSSRPSSVDEFLSLLDGSRQRVDGSYRAAEEETVLRHNTKRSDYLHASVKPLKENSQKKVKWWHLLLAFIGVQIGTFQLLVYSGPLAMVLILLILSVLLVIKLRKSSSRASGSLDSSSGDSSMSFFRRHRLTIILVLLVVMAVTSSSVVYALLYSGSSISQSPKSNMVADKLPMEVTFLGDFTEKVLNIGFDMVYVSGGTFDMGTPSGGSDDERPVHRVNLDGYWMGRHEVTQKLWVAVMGSNPSEFRGDYLPVENVSWNDVQEFITRLNSLTGKNYRLPTEAEWEYAARGGSKSMGYEYSGGNCLDDVGWHGDNSSGSTHPVGSKLPNELGIYDMSGNVLEWCSDWYGGYPSSSQTNPQGPSDGHEKVLRGGSWFISAFYCRSAFRINNSPSIRRNDGGFRLALSL